MFPDPRLAGILATQSADSSRFDPRTLKAIAAAEPGILIHCSAGRDRTGMITAVLLANAGVAPEVIAEDYAESVVAMAGAQANSATADRQATWGSVEVDAWLVAACPLVVDFAAGIDRYLSQAGVQRVERDRLRSLLLAD